jgi:hypothetical protein
MGSFVLLGIPSLLARKVTEALKPQVYARWAHLKT